MSAAAVPAAHPATSVSENFPALPVRRTESRQRHQAVPPDGPGPVVGSCRRHGRPPRSRPRWLRGRREPILPAYPTKKDRRYDGFRERRPNVGSFPRAVMRPIACTSKDVKSRSVASRSSGCPTRVEKPNTGSTTARARFALATLASRSAFASIYGSSSHTRRASTC